MIRVLCRDQNCNEAAHVADAHSAINYKTFDANAPELEQWLRSGGDWSTRTVIGVELIEPKVVMEAKPIEPVF